MELKQEAITLRREIEFAASQLWGPVIGRAVPEICVGNVERRLTLLVARVNTEERLLAFRVARKLGHVYRETSNVLHGRISAAHFNENRIAEWKSDLLRFQEVLHSVGDRLISVEHRIDENCDLDIGYGS